MLRCYFTTIILFLVFFVSLGSSGSYESPYNYELNISGVLISMILLFAGFLFLFLGIQLVSTILFVSGCAFGWLFLVNMFESIDYEFPKIFVIGFPIIGGWLFGGLMMKLPGLFLGFIGAIGGLSLGIIILSISNIPEDDRFIKPMILIALPCIFSVVVMIMKVSVIIVSTSAFGSLLVCLGLDQYLSAGFQAAVEYFLTGNGHYVINKWLFSLIVLYFVFAIIGILHQTKRCMKKNITERDLW